MAIAFITGGNKGLGYETAKRLIKMGYKVYIGSRNGDRGKIAAKGLPDVKVNCADPGSTATDLNGGRGKQTVQEGTDAIVKLATIGKDGPTGTFINRFGEMPW